MTSINPASLGQLMVAGGQSNDAVFSHFMSGNGGPSSWSVQRLQLDNHVESGETGEAGETGGIGRTTQRLPPYVPFIADNDTSLIDEVADEADDVAELDAMTRYNNISRLWRPFFAPSLFQWTAILIFVFILPVLAGYGPAEDSLYPYLDPLTIIWRPKGDPARQGPQPLPSPMACIILPKPPKQNLVEMHCWSERQSHKYEMPAEKVHRTRQHRHGNWTFFQV